jgi:acyl carrier protein
MREMDREITHLIIETLNLDDTDANGIDPEAPLFRDGLGLDSIDALELSLAISTRYGVEIRAEGDDVKQVFSSVHSLSDFVEKRRQR